MLLRYKAWTHVGAHSAFTRVLILTLISFTLSINLSTAQTSFKKKDKKVISDSTLTKWQIGIAGGAGVNRFTKGQPQTGYNTGFNAGLLLHYNFYKGLSLQVEANFLQQGGQTIDFKDDTRIGLPESFSTKNVKNSSYELNTIDIPLMLNYTFNIRPLWKPSVYAGASYDYAYNVIESYQKTGDLLPGQDIIATVNNKQNASGFFNTTRYNLIIGANVHLPITPKFKILLDFRYLSGLTPAREGYSYMEKIGFGSDLRSNSFISRAGLIMSLR